MFRTLNGVVYIGDIFIIFDETIIFLSRLIKELPIYLVCGIIIHLMVLLLNL
jgi:hypothetical protein